MKIEALKRFVSAREWAIGIHAHGAHTLVIMFGTNWCWSFSGGPKSTGDGFVFGLCAGPLTVGYCK